MIRFESATFRYPGAALPALHHVTLTLPEASFTVVYGPSGAGKSTLLRSLNGLVPHFTGGEVSGRIEVAGLNPVAVGPERMCWQVGFVFQDPEAQFVMDRVEDEIAFALENAALPVREMRERVAKVLDLLGLVDLRRRSLASLSGGEKQRVAIAAALALRPSILVLDEPTSQLDPESAEDVLQALAHLNREAGLTIVLAEHRLERVLSFAHRLIHIPAGGHPVRCGSPREVLARTSLVPPVTALGKALGWAPLPVTVAEGRPFALQATVRPKVVTAPVEENATRETPSYLQVENLEAGYGSRPVLEGVNLALVPGEVVVLMGRNGCGKSTLLKALVGLVRPQQGRILLRGHETKGVPVAELCRQIAYLPQDPNALLFADTVNEELAITLRNHGIAAAQAPLAPEELLARLGLTDKADDYPRDLSVGERQRVALAAILVTRPDIVLLDEPTRGLDYEAKGQLLELIRSWRAARQAVLVVTHDVELAAAAADRVVVMASGRIVAQGSAHAILGTVFADAVGTETTGGAQDYAALQSFAPQMVQLFPGRGWLTVDEALAHLVVPVASAAKPAA
jgi:energy-coupling factor transport system ATP-binding protein